MTKKFIIGTALAVAAMGALFITLHAVTARAATTTAKNTTVVAAKKTFYVGGWLPFWQTQAGEQSIAVNLDKFNEISLFSYEIGNNGALVDDLNIGSGNWSGWISAVKELNVKIIPTIAWFDADGIQSLLSSTTSRQAEEDRITNLVTSEQFDGIDIDFEGMYPRTRQYYSLFIEGLAQRLHPLGKKLTCTVVPRTPPSSLYITVPSTIIYPENYTVLGQYCDEVRLMAYDQETADLKLDASKGNGALYAPVADPDWVKKVIQQATPYIPASKIMLGIPTYGYEYEVSWANGETTYQRVRAFDFNDAMDRADSLGISPARDSAGELSFTYSSTTYIQEPPILTSQVPSTEPALLMTPNPNATTTFFVSFPDAQSEMDKVNLAKQYGLRGVMFFKIDGQIDPAIWNQL